MDFNLFYCLLLLILAYKEAICLDALGTLYVNMKFLSICCFFYSNAESIQAILGIIAGHVNPG